jgi:Fe-S-cluster containining protein
MQHRQREELPGQNPCLSCGACCIGYRASFYWAECDDATPGGVPARLTVRADAFRRAMRQGRKGRCVALRGTAGRRVACRIYERRPSVCRQYEPAWQPGAAGERCNEARARLGLAPLGGPSKNPLTESPA